MDATEERVLDAEQWREEAEAVINDVREHVRDLRVCTESKLCSTNRAIYLNLTTLEGSKCCVRLSAGGFTIVGNRHDCADNDSLELESFETMYSLLDSISPKYRNSFGNSLCDKLERLNDAENQ